jgi:ectoine hydroxylase-related dioxygenase (phytanoyl-CoA dioxygenase family)
MTAQPLRNAPAYPLNEVLQLQTCLRLDGFAVTETIYTVDEIRALLAIIDNAEAEQPVFRKTAGLFAIRQFFKAVPSAVNVLLNASLRQLLDDVVGDGYQVVKAIYFDKPEGSNWFVSYHQDLRISVDRRDEFPGYARWTVKDDQFAVQPPLAILEDNITLRIHLDNTNIENGALRVIPGTQAAGISRPEKLDRDAVSEVCCEVPQGGVMLMRPLLMHASGRTVNQKPRRVVHIEFSRKSLPAGLEWSEFLAF